MRLSSFQVWRRFRRGRWARVTGYIWGKRWVPVPIGCMEMAEEDWGEERF